MDPLKSILSELNHNLSRDIAWSVFAPELLNSKENPVFAPELTQERVNWLINFDKQIAINPIDKPKYRRLGRYYEFLWALFLEADQQYKLLCQNLQVKNSERTIGEFDFIIKDNVSNKYIHLEVALKYYLFYSCHPGQNPQNRQYWLGPNSQDYLDKKWRHLTDKQSRLSFAPESIEELEALGIRDIEPRVSLKGYLFTGSSENTRPEDFNNSNQLFKWYYADNMPYNTSCGLALIPKNRWISPFHEKCSIEIMELNELFDIVNKRKTPQLAAFVSENNNCYEETQRFFICPDVWPYSKIDNKPPG